MKRLRLGILLIIISWLPIAQTVLWIAHDNGKLKSEHQSNQVRLLIWAVQIFIGFIGLWLAGKVAIATTKQDGLKKTPSNLWQLFRHGSPDETI
jgi:hypothetical protein